MLLKNRGVLVGEGGVFHRYRRVGMLNETLCLGFLTMACCVRCRFRCVCDGSVGGRCKLGAIGYGRRPGGNIICLDKGNEHEQQLSHVQA